VGVRTKDNGIFVCTRRCLNNMKYQDFLPADNCDPLFTIEGRNLIGCMVSSTLSYYKKFYVLPLNSIKEGKGTGVVTSVPAEAPDDYMAWRDLVNDEAARKKHNIPLEYVEPFKPVSKINRWPMNSFM